MVQDLYVDADIGQVFTADLGKADEGAAAAKVEILQPGEEAQDVVVMAAPVVADDDEEEAPEPAESAQPASAEGDAVIVEPAPEDAEAGEPAVEEPKPAKPEAQGEQHPEAASAPAAAPIPPPIG
jgi:hypothetical protein